MLLPNNFRFILAINFLFTITVSTSFTISSKSINFQGYTKRIYPSTSPTKKFNVFERFPVTLSTSLASSTGNVVISNPSPDNAAEMGIREWPQQTRSGSWQETVQQDATVVRYILEGTGTLCIKTLEREKQNKIGPGTLIEASGQCDLIWDVKENQEMIVLTPGYEEGGKLAVVAIGLIALCIALVVGIGN